MTFFKGRFSRARFAEKLGQIPPRAETTQSNVFQISSDFCNRKSRRVSNMTCKKRNRKKVVRRWFYTMPSGHCVEGTMSYVGMRNDFDRLSKKKKDNHTENTRRSFDLANGYALWGCWDLAMRRWWPLPVVTLTQRVEKKNGPWKKAGFEKRTTWPLQLHT